MRCTNCLQRKHHTISGVKPGCGLFVYTLYTSADLVASMACVLKAHVLFAPEVHPVCVEPIGVLIFSLIRFLGRTKSLSNDRSWCQGGNTILSEALRIQAAF